jgi:hypothetical protein
MHAVRQTRPLHARRRLGSLTIAALLFGVLWGNTDALAQEAGIQGIVTSDGGPLASVLVSLEAPGTPVRSATTDRNGLYLMGSLAPGSYTLRVQTLGYAMHEQTVTLVVGDRITANVRLEPAAVSIEGVEVQAGAEGSAIRDFGAQRITPTQVRRVPTPAASGDLATYLQTLPGVVTTGDRGGQIFVRGGTHTENITLMDGLTVYQPFHIIGFFSAFPEELVSNVDFYAGGFGARYHGRTSSVMDVQMREGNREQYSGSASVSPFLAEARLEGPLSVGRTSWIGSFRRSLIEETSGSYMAEEQPISFESQFLKVTSVGASDSRCSATFLRTNDEGRLDPEASDSRVAWSNLAIGTRCAGIVNEARSFLDINVGYSSVDNEAVVRGASELLATVSKLYAEVTATGLLGNTRVEYGYRASTETGSYQMTELFGKRDEEEKTVGMSLFGEARYAFNDRLTIIPGAVLMALPRAAIEPRLRMTWRPGFSEAGELTAAAGLYTQDLVGISDVRDVGSIFVAWMRAADDQPIRSLHAQVGWQQRHDFNLNWSVESYFRDLKNVSVPLWGTIAAYETELGLANGYSYGLDSRIEFTGDRLYGFLGYGLSLVRYKAAQESFNTWFGEPVQEYHPPHDRRHQLNAVLGYEFPWIELQTRWQLSSGLPFTRPFGFDETFDYRWRVPIVRNEVGITRMIVEKPYLGRLPLVHRLDVSVKRGFDVGPGRVELQAGAINAYDQTNLFYYDLFTQRRVDQIPFAPYAAITLKAR